MTERNNELGPRQSRTTGGIPPGDRMSFQEVLARSRAHVPVDTPYGISTDETLPGPHSVPALDKKLRFARMYRTPAGKLTPLGPGDDKPEYDDVVALVDRTTRQVAVAGRSDGITTIVGSNFRPVTGESCETVVGFDGNDALILFPGNPQIFRMGAEGLSFDTEGVKDGRIIEVDLAPYLLGGISGATLARIVEDNVPGGEALPKMGYGSGYYRSIETGSTQSRPVQETTLQDTPHLEPATAIEPSEPGEAPELTTREAIKQVIVLATRNLPLDQEAASRDIHVIDGLLALAAEYRITNAELSKAFRDHPTLSAVPVDAFAKAKEAANALEERYHAGDTAYNGLPIGSVQTFLDREIEDGNLQDGMVFVKVPDIPEEVIPADLDQRPDRPAQDTVTTHSGENTATQLPPVSKVLTRFSMVNFGLTLASESQGMHEAAEAYGKTGIGLWAAAALVKYGVDVKQWYTDRRGDIQAVNAAMRAVDEPTSAEEEFVQRYFTEPTGEVPTDMSSATETEVFRQYGLEDTGTDQQPDRTKRPEAPEIDE